MRTTILTSRTSLAPSAFALVVMLGAAVTAGCSESRPTPAAPIAKTDAGAVVVEAIDAAVQVATAARDAGTSDAGYDGPRIGALYMQTPIMSEMEWPIPEDSPRRERDKGKERSVRIGYLRQGAKAPVIPEVHKKSNCAEGWYELVAGGFVCGKYATMDLNHPRIKLAPHPPDPVNSLPYQYGYNITNGTPLYRTIPSREERLKFEPWLAAKAKPKPKKREDDSPYDDLDAGAGAAVTAALATTGDPSDGPDGGTPWFLRDYDGGKPQVTLDELKGEGPMSRRMVRGFYLALDKEMTGGGTKWWRTTGGLMTPYDRIYVQKPITEFHGIWLQNDGPKVVYPLLADGGVAPQTLAMNAAADGGASGASGDGGTHTVDRVVGFTLWVHAHKYVLSADHKKATQGESIPRFTIAKLTGESAVVGGQAYDETDEGWWMKASEGTKTKPGDPPKDIGEHEKWIDVNLTTQTLVAFEGTTPVYATLVSSGRRDLQNKEKDHPTPTGSFRIREKHIAATMDGDVASDGPYSIEDVPWIMYFQGSYALHGAFWHSNFGHVQSHGCVNLSPPDAKALFGWTEPSLPESWHGVMATEEKPGSRVIVHE